jgi:NAD-dependent dihydropyrimidine dehydrogenase PreA subunit
MKIKRKIIQIDEERCDGCGQCVPACAEGAIEIIDGKARVHADRLCDGLGACLGECPNDALHVVEREADEFDEIAVEKHLEQKKTAESQPAPGRCPSSGMQIFHTPETCDAANVAAPAAGGDSELGHWPVQIRLVPPNAPFLKGADLLVVADCVPVAHPDFHRTFLKGRAVVMGCPKFDDVPAYIDKFAQMFSQNGIRSVTTLIMEVPCCSGLPMIVKKGMEAAGVSIPAEEIVISRRGKVLKQVTR